MIKRVICILVLLISFSNFGQGFTKHTVLKGETVPAIAQKYKVTPYDIYKLNPDSQNGIKENSILLIPKSIPQSNSSAALKTTATNKVIDYTVVAGDTKYNVAKRFGISVEEKEKKKN